MKVILSIVFGVMCSSFYSPTARAQVYIILGSTGNDAIYVGTHYDASQTRWEFSSCVVNASYPNGVVAQLDPSFNMQKGAYVLGDAGDDGIYIIRTLSTLSQHSGCSGLWVAPNYNGYHIRVEGEGGSDYIEGGNGPTYGSDGDDIVLNYATGFNFSDGGNGSDWVYGYAGSGDRLLGGEGNDCLDDMNNAYLSYDCGPGVDNRQSGDTYAVYVNCEYTASCCGFGC